MRYIISFVILSLLLVSISEVFGEKKTNRKSFKHSIEIVKFYKNEKDDYDLKIIQPYLFDPGAIQKSLGSLYYQKRVLTWSNKIRIFNPSVVEHFTPWIVKQFSIANSEQKIEFKIRDANGKIFIKGDTFLTEEGLHWRFTVLNRKKRKIDDFSIMGDKWRMLPQENQTYKKKNKYKNLVQDITNWIVAGNIRPLPSGIIKKTFQKEEFSKGEIVSAPNTSDIKKRLRILDDLKKEALINEEEYQMKRKIILESF